MKALEILEELKGYPYWTRRHNLDEAIAELEELIKSVSCNGCKYDIKYPNYDMDTGERLDDLIPKQCWECSRNTRQCDDRYEEKINNEILNPTTILKYRRN